MCATCSLVFPSLHTCAFVNIAVTTTMYVAHHHRLVRSLHKSVHTLRPLSVEHDYHRSMTFFLSTIRAKATDHFLYDIKYQYTQYQYQVL